MIVVWEFKSEVVREPGDVMPFFVMFLSLAGEFVLDVFLESAVGVPLVFKVCSEGLGG